jgi:hypothetical protein
LKENSSTDQQFIRLSAIDWVMVEKHEAKSFPTPELYIKATGDNREREPIGGCHISTAALGEYGFSLEGIYHNREDLRQEVKSNNWTLGTSYRGMVAVLRIKDIHGVPFLVLLKTEKGLLLVNVEKADESESLKEVFSNFNSRPSTSQGRTWRNDADRVFWQQPNGTWVVSVATKKQIVNGEMAQAVIITGHAPLKNPGER